MCLGKDMIHESICEVVSEVLVLTVKSQIERIGGGREYTGTFKLSDNSIRNSP